MIRRKRDLWLTMACGRTAQRQEIPLGRGPINFEDGVFLPELPGLRVGLNGGGRALDPKAEAWYLLSDLLVGRAILNRYCRHFWIEAMFGDFKAAGFRLEKTPLTNETRGERLLLCVGSASTWSLFLGAGGEAEGKRGAADRANRPTSSLFEFVVRYLRRLFCRREEFPRFFRLSSPKCEG